MHKHIIKLTLKTTLIISTILLTTSITNALTATVKITKTPHLAFYQIPESYRITSTQTPPTTDTELTSDQSNQDLPESRYLTIQDTRNCGGFTLQVSASEFQPSPTSPNPSLNNGFRIITSTNDAISGANVETDSSYPGVKYYGENGTNFIGTKQITAPLNVTTTNFADPTLFTQAPFNNGSNILTANTPIDIMQGGLTAPAGRKGLMHLSLSYYLKIPKFTAPNNYYTTLTYTLIDNTSGSC